MQRPRTRLVNFRVSDDEFNQLRRACSKQGARCLSDFARTVMLTAPTAVQHPLATSMAALEDRVAALDASMRQLTKVVHEALRLPVRTD